MEIGPVLVAARLIAVDVVAALTAGAFDTTFMIVTVALPDSALVGRIYTFLASRALASKRSGGRRSAYARSDCRQQRSWSDCKLRFEPSRCKRTVGTYLDWLRRLRWRYSDELRLVMDRVVGSR